MLKMAEWLRRKVGRPVVEYFNYPESEAPVGYASSHERWLDHEYLCLRHYYTGTTGPGPWYAVYRSDAEQHGLVCRDC